MSKASFFKKILRVAVKSDDRKFTFDFSIIDELGEKYSFTAKPGDRAIMQINGVEIKHTALQKLVEFHKKDIFAIRRKTTENIKKFKLKNRRLK